MAGIKILHGDGGNHRHTVNTTDGVENNFLYLNAKTIGTGTETVNIDSDQKFEFNGLPAPANALFIVALPLLFEHPLFSNLKPFLATYPALMIICIVSAILMNIRLPLFSFKIKYLNIQEYGYQFALLLCVVPIFYFFQWVAVPLLILIYLILNVVKNSFN